MTRALLLGLLLVLCASPGAAAQPPATLPWSAVGELVVSPDGRHLYATGNRTLTFARDARSGGLSPVDDNEPPGSSIAIAPDGGHVYVGSAHGLHVLRRDGESGSLTHLETIEEGDASTHPSSGITRLVLSPDGLFLYALLPAEEALLAFARDGASGALSHRQSLFGGLGGAPELDRAADVAMSADGRNLYIDGGGGFARDPATGLLEGRGASAAEPGPSSTVAIAPDGRRVYSGFGGGWVTSYGRDESGTLSALGTTWSGPECQPDPGDPCSGDGNELLVSPDSRAVYAFDERAVYAFDEREDALYESRVTEAGLEPVRHYFNGRDGIEGMVNPAFGAWSPDGRHVYVSSERRLPTFDDPETTGALTVFARDGQTNALRFVGSGRPRFQTPSVGSAPLLTINGGAQFTNTRDVAVSMTCPYPASSLRLANDGGLQGSALFPIVREESYSWRLASEGPRRTVKRVYGRCTDTGTRSQPQTVFDDIILDERPPVLVDVDLIEPRVEPAAAGARRRMARLIVRARDERSGVTHLQYVDVRTLSKDIRPFARVLRVPARYRKLRVRVFDGAGNSSRWQTVRAARG